MSDWLIIIQNVKCEHIHKYLNLIDVGVLPRTGCQNLEGQKLFRSLIYSDYLAIQNERFQVVLMSFHALLDVLHEIYICLGDVL